jgi:TPR repeat protein
MSSDSEYHTKPNSDEPVLDYDEMNVRFAQVNPKLDRLLTAMQKGRAPPGEKSEIAQLIRHLFEPWRIDPARVSYRLDKEIGAGGFGRVYKGKLGNASVAVKVVNAALLSADVSLKADFLREASLLAELRHPCIVEFLGAYWPDAEALELADARSADSGSDGDEEEERGAGVAKRGKPGADPSRAYIVMELMSCSLVDAGAKYCLSAIDVTQAIYDVAEALRFMHSKGIVHMDVKAENVLVNIDRRSGRLEGCAKVGDFGVSRKKRETVSAQRNRETALAAGTRVFMAPELLRGTCGAEKACDVWSFGTLMCQLLSTARCPVLDKSDGFWLEKAAEDHTLQGEMRKWASSIDVVRARQLALRCLADDPQSRPSMEQVVEVLEWDDEQVARLVRQADGFRDGTGGVSVQRAKASALYRRAADAGDAGAMFSLGLCYANGLGVAEDKAAAVAYYRRAADAGDAAALRILGIHYENGDGVAEDKVAALEYYQRAAEAGDSDALQNLGLCYEYGDGVAEDKAAAVSYYRRAADAGVARALHNLGRCYENGCGVAEDKAAAVEYYRRAADARVARALHNLGLCYENGLGVAEDKAAAVEYYRRAADAGVARALHVGLGTGSDDG